jgi:hypothetical protein
LFKVKTIFQVKTFISGQNYISGQNIYFRSKVCDRKNVHRRRSPLLSSGSGALAGHDRHARSNVIKDSLLSLHICPCLLTYKMAVFDEVIEDEKGFANSPTNS